jgi:AcrR family transcriptional regulator
MRSRAEAAERLSEQIIDAAYELWLERSYDEITLQEVAERAGASLSSVMRRFGSKEGIVEAIISTDRMGEATLREGVEAGDVDGALAALHAGGVRLAEVSEHVVVDDAVFRQRDPRGELFVREEQLLDPFERRLVRDAAQEVFADRLFIFKGFGHRLRRRSSVPPPRVT